MIAGKKILLGITGSIAAYKSILLVRSLVKQGAEVKVIMTPAAKDFVTPLSLSTISKNEVLTDLFREESWNNHVMLGRWADLMLIAPLSCNTLAKMANGQCDNLLLATYLSATCPVVAAPAMDEDMWHHPSTRLNIERVLSYGNHIIPVDTGELASGLYGDGRMAEPDTIISYVDEHFFFSRELSGKKALVTAGPTHESLDPVRYIGNQSTGKMGIAVARELAQRGALVDLVLGPSGIAVEIPHVQVQRVESAGEMYEACMKLFPEMDITVMSAAVADYTPVEVSAEKIKKSEGTLTVALKRTRDILKAMGEQKKNGQILVGFALEKQNEREYALRKLKNKNADLIVLNSLNDPGAGFGHDSNKITIFEKNGSELAYGQKPKQQVAKDIVDRIVNMIQ
jgi:phosphopantothenoylcysteine decarboxylase / phosphopantothenate---cysteine ligase